MNSKTSYTHRELTRRSTDQLIRIYNRLFNTNAWDEWFNPYEHRQTMLVALMNEMNMLQIAAEYPADETPVKRYKALEIVVSLDGIVIVWRADRPDRKNNRKYGKDIVREVFNMRAQGISIRAIANELQMKKNRVFRILNGTVYAD